MNASWDDEYLTVNEIAAHLKLNPQTIRNWIDRDELPAVRVGRRVRVRRVDLDHKLARGATTFSPTAYATPLQPNRPMCSAIWARHSVKRTSKPADSLGAAAPSAAPNWPRASKHSPRPSPPRSTY